jgi:hypothetical protein
MFVRSESKCLAGSVLIVPRPNDRMLRNKKHLSQNRQHLLHIRTLPIFLFYLNLLMAVSQNELYRITQYKKPKMSPALHSERFYENASISSSLPMSSSSSSLNIWDRRNDMGSTCRIGHSSLSNKDNFGGMSSSSMMMRMMRMSPTGDTDNNDGSEEISRDQVLDSLLWDDELLLLQDGFHLESNLDGTRIPALKAFLAAKSPVFRRMLLGPFAEAQKSTVLVHYPGTVLQILIEYIYNDQIERPLSRLLLGLAQQQKQEPEGRAADIGPFGLVSTLMSLMDAANYYGLPTLRQKSEEFAKNLINQDRHQWVMPFLGACQSSSVAPGVEDHCLAMLRCHPADFLASNNDCIHWMSAFQLERLLQDDKVQADELTLFRVLQAWASSSSTVMIDEEGHHQSEHSKGSRKEEDDNDKSSTLTTTAMTASKESSYYNSSAKKKNIIFGNVTSHRKEQAHQLARHLCLDRIDPIVELRQTIKPSGIVSEEQLCDAQEAQASMARQQQQQEPRRNSATTNSASSSLLYCHKLPRSQTHGWDLSEHAIVEGFELKHEAATLSCRPMTRGSIHQWSIRVERNAKFNWLGITTATTSNVSSSSASSLLHPAVEPRDSDETATAEPEGSLYGPSVMACLNLIKQLEQSWVYGSNGLARHMAQTTPGNFPTYTEGCIVSFRLDLTEQLQQGNGGVKGNCGGTLSARVRQEAPDEATNGGVAAVGGSVSPWFQLFTNLNASLSSLQPDEYENSDDTENDDSDKGSIGFVPTVFIKIPGKVHFLGFEPVDFCPIYDNK